MVVPADIIGRFLLEEKGSVQCFFVQTAYCDMENDSISAYPMFCLWIAGDDTEQKGDQLKQTFYCSCLYTGANGLLAKF